MIKSSEKPTKKPRRKTKMQLIGLLAKESKMSVGEYVDYLLAYALTHKIIFENIVSAKADDQKWNEGTKLLPKT